MTNILHYIDDSTPDGTRTTTLCGSPLTADRAGAASIMATGSWTMCPLCELRRTLIGMGLEADPYPERPARRRWEQPPLF
ncbi:MULTISPECIES: hypothetical protein [Bifidobacterium]|uniref:Uncharacterized protein n=1 Tax=Bifidobacterium dentium (strain ATCC 27534 / DSM 20436 / JCM 1195 / Bd1) TaxID=401473 RepID=D2Q8Z7_BIFDB|nr:MULTISPECIES: hypothetical protein [Bifidobacterium]ADB09283.1 hypothetical protein BDP_0616 [Bifidobacterium dentium Bd1]EDT44352.1 hypothetical protein BIFDEN_00143 [Bifidobacterium dentium ATCC 27678]SEB72883.1 hypothetical protein SAMN05192536_0681 [Bifidobacterium dentium JCM 1195 = DSM 20436]VEG23253.1 Uncharacterised protein [Bifidobacterium dentium]BAQ26583.1 hypothetical protein BBDE_0589 [Bifidobacterium dentium JCM 1195 = DSM 20436]